MKIMRSIIAAMLILMLSGNTALAASDVATAQTATGDIEVLETYEYSSEWGYKYLIAVCENKTDKDLEVSWDTISYDSAGNILETGSSYSAYVAGEQAFTLYALFLDSEDATDYQYKIKSEEAKYIVPAFDDVTIDHNISSNGKLIISATNTSNNEISTIQAATLFFDDNDNLIGFEDSYIVNSNYNLDAGETVVKDLDVPDGAAYYWIYYTAYRY